MKTIAITGANGFVGKNLTEYLSTNYNIIPITRNTFNLLDYNETQNFFGNNKIDVIIHCANEGGSRKTAYSDDYVVSNNLKMFFNLRSCITPNMKLITFGSGAQYAKARDLIKVSECQIGQVLPNDDYGFSKFVISQTIANNQNIYSPIIFGLYGKHEDYRFKFISNAIMKNLLNMPITINQNVVFDYLFIDDFLKIIDLYIQNDYKNKEFNITPTAPIDLIGIAEIINSFSPFKSEIIVKNKGKNYEYTASNKLMLEDIPDFTFTSYESGIKKLYKYYEQNLTNLDTQSIIDDNFIKYCKVNKNEKN